MRIKPISHKYYIISLLVILLGVNCHAQNSKEEKYYINNDKHWLVELPIWVPGFRGQFAYGDLEFSSSGNKKEREYERLNSKTNIEFYFAGKVAARYNKFRVQLDAFSGKIGSTFTWEPINGNSPKELVNIEVQGTLPRLSVGYAIWEKRSKNSIKFELIPYLGLRYVNIHLQSDIFGSMLQINLQPDWFEPTIGIYLPFCYKRFKTELDADFGISNTKLSWTFNYNIRYRIS